MLEAAVIGCGPRGVEHAEAIRDATGLRLAAVVDLDPDLARPLGDRLGAAAFNSLTAAMDAAAPDVVVIATPARGRAALCGQAAAHHRVRAVVLEKPLATSLSEARELLRECRRQGVLLLVSHQLRFCSEFVSLHEAVSRGDLGEIRFIRGACYGNLLNQGPHLLDAICWLAGEQRLQWVTSHANDDPALIERYGAGPIEHQRDRAHPGPMWMTHELAFEGGLRAFLETGLLYQRSDDFVDDWLQKRIVVEGTGGLAEAQVAGHYKELTAERSGWRVESGSVEDYHAATRRFHEALHRAVTADAAHRCEASAAMASFEALAACAQSAVDGRTAMLPVDADRNCFSELAKLRRTERIRVEPEEEGGAVDPGDGLALSVILPLADHRGYATRCVDSFVKGQSLPGDAFEMIVLSDGREPALEAKIEASLRPQDQLIRYPTDIEMEHYHLGAGKASGRLVLFTEPHCIADPDCLHEVVRYFARRSEDGACLRSLPGCTNAMARMEDRFYEAGFRTWGQPGDWRKAILRGFAIRRSVYEAAGGFQHRYGRFSEWLLAATLHRHGKRLGYCRDAAVLHFYETSFHNLLPPVWDFTQGEFRYRAENPDDEACDAYFGVVPEWVQRWRFDRRVNWAAAQAAWETLKRHVLTHRTEHSPALLRVVGSTLRRCIPLVVGGPRLAAMNAMLAYQLARLRCWCLRFDDEGMYGPFTKAWEAMVHAARLDFIASHAKESALELSQRCEYDMGEVDDRQLIGFHSRESWQGESFRWTEPVAVFRFSLPAGDYEVAVEIKAARPETTTLPLTIMFNRRCISGDRIRIEGGWIRFPVSKRDFILDGEQLLTIVTLPFSAPGDRRALGLPVFAIQFVSGGRGGRTSS